MKKFIALTLTLVTALSLVACGEKNNGAENEIKIVKIGVVGSYNAQWEKVNEILEPEGIKVELITFSDYATPNPALNDGEVDMNAFQHKAFLADQIEKNGYKIVDIADTFISPIALFNNKDKISSVADIKDGAKIAIPHDLTNGGRALKLLEAEGLIVCDPEKGVIPSKADIIEYKVKIDIVEAESGMLFNLLPDCEGAIINGGNAFTAGLNPMKDAIAIENVDTDVNPDVDRLVNILAVREADKDNELYKKIADTYRSEEVKQTLLNEYSGAFIPVW